jgi:site-specific DNA recombinase
MRRRGAKTASKMREANSLHPKVVRQALRLAFLALEITSAVLEGSQPKELSLARIPKLLSSSWAEHRLLPG